MVASTACAGAGDRGADAGDATARGVRARSSHAGAGGDEVDITPCLGAKGDVFVWAEAPSRSTPLYTRLPKIKLLKKILLVAIIPMRHV
jgi:hypothetical protein